MTRELFRCARTVKRALGNDFWLCAHDASGHHRLTAGATGLGAAGALLAELLESRQLELDNAFEIRLPQRQPALVDHSHMTLVDALTRRPEQTDLADWLHTWQPDAATFVALRLVQAGDVQRVEIPANWLAGRVRPRVRFVPANCVTVHEPGDHLATVLPRGTATSADAILAGLLRATHLHRTVITGVPSLDELIVGVTEKLRSPLRALLAQVELAVGQAQLSHRLK